MLLGQLFFPDVKKLIHNSIISKKSIQGHVNIRPTKCPFGEFVFVDRNIHRTISRFDARTHFKMWLRIVECLPFTEYFGGLVFSKNVCKPLYELGCNKWWLSIEFLNGNNKEYSKHILYYRLAIQIDLW